MKLRLSSIPTWIIFAVVPLLWLGLSFFQDGAIPFWKGANYTDLLVSHIPNSIYIKNALASWGQIPLWNSMILSGIPFAADPLAGLFYPPYWLSLILPVETGFTLIFWAHLVWAGIGTWKLAREEGVGRIGSIIAGLAFAGSPKFVAHIGLGHVGLVSAVSWTPWVLFTARQALENAGLPGPKWIKNTALAGMCLGIVFLADPRWSVPCGLLVFAYGVFISAGKTIRLHLIELLQNGFTYLGFAFMFAAVLALPLMEFSFLSTRWGLAGQEQALFSLPLTGLIGIIVPVQAQPEWMIFAGVSVLYLATTAFLKPGRSLWFWLGVVLTCILLALGSATPLYAIFNKVIPGASLLRVPPRWIFIAWLGLAMLAGYGISAMGKYRTDEAIVRRMRLFTIGFFAFTGLVGAGGIVLGISTSTMGIVSLLLLGAAFFWAILTYSGRITTPVLTAGWVLLLALELAWVDQDLLEYRSFTGESEGRVDAVDVLPGRGSNSRILSPSYSVTQVTAAVSRLQLSDGVNPLQLESYYRYMADGMGYPPGGYSVTLPPFPNGDPAVPWGFTPDLELLRKLNVAAIASAYPLDIPELQFIDLVDGTYVYGISDVRPRAWVEEERDRWSAVQSMEWTPNHIQIEAEGPGLLVLSEIVYPGWAAFVDGRRADILTYDRVFRAIELSQGEHQVNFKFQSVPLISGLILTVIGIIGITWVWVRD